MKKLLLLGATGRTGKHVLQIALAKGYEVTCLVRDVSKIKPARNLRLLEGSPSNERELSLAMQGNELIISTLNVSRVSDFPWAPLRTPKTFMSDVMAKLVKLNEEHSVKRLIVCSAWGVADAKNEIPFWFRWLIDTSNIGAAYKDHERQESVLERSNIDWTIVRPVGLLNSEKEQEIRESFGNIPKPRLTINRKTVAAYLLSCLENDNLIGKKVVISRE